MTTEIKIKGHIQNTNDAKEIFDEVVSNIEKHYEKFYGFFTVSFENQLGFPRKNQMEKIEAAPEQNHSDTITELLSANKPFSSVSDKPITITFLEFKISENIAKFAIKQKGKKDSIYRLPIGCSLVITSKKSH